MLLVSKIDPVPTLMELVILGRRNYSNNHTYINAKCFPEEDVQMKRADNPSEKERRLRQREIGIRKGSSCAKDLMT